MIRRSIIAVAVELVLLVAACGSAAALPTHLPAAHSLASLRSASPALRVTSSLDGMQTLPQRIRWRAFPKVAAGDARRVFEVDFLIDGKPRCVEHFAPWNYGSDDFHGHLGWLVTSWLEPGTHTFTARASFQDGTSAADSVVAQVTASPPLPAALATGRWKRTVTKADREKYKGELPTGTWNIVFDQTGVWELDPLGTGIAEHVTVHGNTIAIDAALWMVPYVNGHYPQLRRYGHRDIGAGWREDGPPAVYRWTVSGNTLTLIALHEVSGSRHALWEGTWVRR